MAILKHINSGPSTNGPEEGQLTEQNLKFGYWLTVHRPQLYRALIAALIVFDVALGGYNLWRWIDYAFFGYWADQQLVTEIRRPIVNPTLSASHTARDLQVEGVSIFPIGAHADAVALARNPNANYLAKVDYDFVVGTTVTEQRSAVILPQEEKPLTALGLKEAGGEALLELKKVSWMRIPPHVIADVAEYQSQRLNWELQNFKYIAPGSQGVPYGQIKFEVVNNSAYGFWQAKGMLLLTVQEQTVGVETFALDDFQAGETRAVTINLLDSLSPTGAKLYPDVDIFDPSVYMK